MKLVFTLNLEDVVTLIILAVVILLILYCIIEAGINNIIKKVKHWWKSRRDKDDIT